MVRRDHVEYTLVNAVGLANDVEPKLDVVLYVAAFDDGEFAGLVEQFFRQFRFANVE